MMMEISTKSPTATKMSHTTNNHLGQVKSTTAVGPATAGNNNASKRFRFDSFATEFASNPTSPKDEVKVEDNYADNDSGIDAEDAQISPCSVDSKPAIRHWKKSLKDQASAAAAINLTVQPQVKEEEEEEEAENLCIKDLKAKEAKKAAAASDEAKDVIKRSNADHHHVHAAHALLSLGNSPSPSPPLPAALSRPAPAVLPVPVAPSRFLPNLPTKPVPICSSVPIKKFKQELPSVPQHPASFSTASSVPLLKKHLKQEMPRLPQVPAAVLQPFSTNVMTPFRTGVAVSHAAPMPPMNPLHQHPLTPMPTPSRGVLGEIRTNGTAVVSRQQHDHLLASLPPVPTPNFGSLRMAGNLFPAAGAISPPLVSPPIGENNMPSPPPPGALLLPSPSSSTASLENASSSSFKKSRSNKVSKPFQCLECKKGFSTQSGYAKHQQLHCTNQIQKTFSCNYCTKGYTSLSALKMHIRTHTLPCKCETCGKSFSRPWLLQGHMRTHTGEKPFGCDYCARSFADKSNLRAHLQTHLQTKKYSCAGCHKTFSRMSLLNKHTEGGCHNLQTRNEECVQTLIGLSSSGGAAAPSITGLIRA